MWITPPIVLVLVVAIAIENSRIIHYEVEEEDDVKELKRAFQITAQAQGIANCHPS